MLREEVCAQYAWEVDKQQSVWVSVSQLATVTTVEIPKERLRKVGGPQLHGGGSSMRGKGVCTLNVVGTAEC